ncbi:hypothetical protein QBC33DRAFT_539387 [Phialemonium atrogriseum]|uniref:Inner kinetochore subunit AME1 domain-containing protein n=1 Tax=Phialemonium atrogriseum TaxID=1093897 RepID=A0AAJ0FG21_9PEZI|nr:uncharacterized protein QBC33DRAFT_539387 [Phialemonium atrogriseum]KAK1767156.1 hypothetical protein QBC33DRAFT_539387 [Phialemonium atrogriseum]
MATGREERMASRLRGAQRHQVEDVSFGIILPTEDEQPEVHTAAQSPPSAPAPTRSTPNTSAQRRRIAGPKPSSADRPAAQPSTATRTRSARVPAPPVPVPAPATSAGRTRLAAAAAAARPNIYDIPDNTSDETPSRRRGAVVTTAASSTTRRSSALRRPFTRPPPADDGDEDDLESLPGGGPTPTNPAQAASRQRPSLPPSSLRRRGAGSPTPAAAAAAAPRSPGVLVTEEVAESPADAPGSGQRRMVMRGAVASSALLQRIVGVQDDGDEDEVGAVGEETVDVARLAQASSPLTRKSRPLVAGARSSTTTRARSVRVEGGGGVDGLDELSPENVRRGAGIPRRGVADDVDELSPENTRRSARLSAAHVADQEDELSPEKAGEDEQPKSAAPSQRGRKARGPAVSSQTGQSNRSGRGETIKRPVQQKQAAPVTEREEEQEEAEEIDEREAARRLGRKRPRRSMPEPSPESDPQPAEEERAAKKRRRKAPESPAVQRQPRAEKHPARPRAKPGNAARRKRDAVDELEGDAANGTVPVTVQRFTKKVVRYDADDTGADILSSDIPFANRGGVNAIDVLSQMCEVLIDNFLSNLEERARDAEDSAARREFRTMMRALEAFREELRTRFLEQTIALDALHALRKRVRAAQKEKLALRDEILSIRAERDQVGLRMDAVRIKHEADSKEALRNIHLSSTMHDIDLAVEEGLAAPPLPAAQEREAELANLELLIARVADQACTNSDGGGALGRMREFNAFLERAAAVLEGR